jgi:colanic acid/amylovoran biosynthesis glycosyltransferase
LRAMKLVQRTHPQCRLTIIGEGPLRPPLEALAKQLNLGCEFSGAQPAAIVRESLRRARIVCVPSVTAANGDSEGLPTVVAEALATGVPVVSTRHAGIPEIVIPNVTGLLVPERDAGALADALRLLLVDRALWESIHETATNHMETRFDLKMQTALLENIYTGITATKL